MNTLTFCNSTAISLQPAASRRLGVSHSACVPKGLRIGLSNSRSTRTVLTSHLKPPSRVAAVQCVASAEGPASSGSLPFASSTASLTRALLVGQPSTVLRSIAARRMPAGPMSLLLFLFGLVAAALSAIRAALVKRVKDCKCCRGFGIVRCPLCSGLGLVDWRAKFGHSEICPLCMTRRYVVCSDCGGHYHRRIFVHFRTVGKSLGDIYSPNMNNGTGTIDDSSGGYATQ